MRLLGAAWLIIWMLSGCSSGQQQTDTLPADFVYLGDIDSSIQQDIRYFTSNNFIGRPVSGYFTPRCILTRSAAEALSRAQRLAAGQGLSLKVYDCYRPQQAVNDFVAWAADPDDVLFKHRFYPSVPKAQLFTLGFIAERSGHSRGSTVDLTLVLAGSAQPLVEPYANRYDCRQARPLRYPDNSLDMGTGYDCFDSGSITDNAPAGSEAEANRRLLTTLMEASGFNNYPQEWWHFTLDQEPFPDDYFDFPIADQPQP